MLRWLRALFRTADPELNDESIRRARHTVAAEIAEDPNAGDDPEPVEIPITDALDLHPFRPAEISDVVRSYLDEVIDRGYTEVRIIHGRGIGTQREIVRKVLERDPRVLQFADATSERGGWGATVAVLAGSTTTRPQSGSRPP